ncbi:ABC transporter substrate-binding protein [Fredinandcohnia quinoae]|uniref:Extracellular solute-binding protein n=1 Tax=Fredinandcohnia quinoae TaxID=2918902 RepID=A0AAW5DZ85_9BACI|nr:extracellular solute-binding protein [Fredinandcohnia sp. SECRCQ15]MCH1625966.1 extracellular solute-binding protein [Fredinandcohnia sp. SECRCQ15]
MKKKSFKLMLVIMAMSLLLLAACSGKSSGGEKPDDGGKKDPDKAAEKVELRVVTTMAGTDPAGKVFQEVLDEFQKQNTNVTIVNDSQSADAGTIRTKVNTDFSSNNEPELMFFFNTIDAQGIIEAGKVVDLENAEGVDLSGFNSMLEQQRNKDGKIYAAPQSGFYEGLFVNKKLFEENNVKIPTTWEEYEAAIEAFAKTDIIPVAASTVDSYYVVEHYALAAGGIDNYNAKLSDKNKAWAEGLDNIAKHAKMGAFPADAATIDLAMAADLFKQEQAAMIYEGSWFWGQIEEAGMAENVSVIPVPVYGDGGQTGDLVGGASQGWFISQKAFDDESKKKVVVDLFNFITSEANLLKIVGATGQPPAKGALTDLSEHIAAGHKLVANATAVSMPINDRILPEAFTFIRESVPSVVNGDKTGAQVIEEAAAME